MSRAAELFERFQREGKAMLDAMIEQKLGEELFLDFKRSADDGSGRSLHNNDRRNLEKAACGFSNSEGGVVFWGVDCTQDRDRGDIPTGYSFSATRRGSLDGCNR
jgi:hypothetical protein